LASLLPFLAVVGRPWPGFFYNPYYTTNVFTDQTTPAWKAGLRPEDRVIIINKLRIDRLQPETEKAGIGGEITLVYELGRVLASIPVQVEELSWFRFLEKAAPMYLTGLLLCFYGWAKTDIFLKVFQWLCGLALLIASDYFLGAGCGLESGLSCGSKWSAFGYWPLWSVAGAFGWAWLLKLLLASSKWYRWWGLCRLLLGLLLLLDLMHYLISALTSATYNNPDYIIWHNRGEFWLLWLGLVVLLAAAVWQKRLNLNWKKAVISGVGLGLFILGFVVPTTFDLSLPGLGPQWYSLGLALFARHLTVITHPLTPSRGKEDGI
jgi:hypothetical protein